MSFAEPAEQLVRFESYELDVQSRELRRGEERVRLQAQPLEVLVMLLERAALGDHADRPRFVETLPRRGYRFVAHFRSTTGEPMRHRRPRVAVLPFTDDGGELSAGDFSDGLTDEMILQLGRLEAPSVDVIARASSLAFRRSSCLAREIAATLRADYLLEGSVRRQGDRARIAAWLVETSGETQLWTDAFDRRLTDALAIQTEVAARIAGAVASHMSVQSAFTTGPAVRA